MEFLVIIFIPMILLLLGAGFLVVSQVSGFVQYAINTKTNF